MPDKRLDQTTNAAAVAATDNIPFVTAAGVTSYVTGDEFATSSILTSRYVSKSDDHIWIPAGGFAQIYGTVDQGLFTVPGTVDWPGVLFDDGNLEAVGATAYIPSWWNSWNFEVWWTNAGTNSGNVRFVWLYNAVGSGDTIGVTSSIGVTYAAPARNVVQVTSPFTGRTEIGKMIVFHLQRQGADANDTLTNAVAILGVRVVRAS